MKHCDKCGKRKTEKKIVTREFHLISSSNGHDEVLDDFEIEVCEDCDKKLGEIVRDEDNKYRKKIHNLIKKWTEIK